MSIIRLLSIETSTTSSFSVFIIWSRSNLSFLLKKSQLYTHRRKKNHFSCYLFINFTLPKPNKCVFPPSTHTFFFYLYFSQHPSFITYLRRRWLFFTLTILFTIFVNKMSFLIDHKIEINLIKFTHLSTVHSLCYRTKIETLFTHTLQIYAIRFSKSIFIARSDENLNFETTLNNSILETNI